MKSAESSNNKDGRRLDLFGSLVNIVKVNARLENGHVETPTVKLIIGYRVYSVDLYTVWGSVKPRKSIMKYIR